MKTTTHDVDLHDTKEELLTLFDLATREDVDHGGHDECWGGVIHVWSHPWTNEATRYDSVMIGAFDLNGLEERMYRRETEEGFDLADLLYELAILELASQPQLEENLR
jgi:hypothetical protein